MTNEEMARIEGALAKPFIASIQAAGDVMGTEAALQFIGVVFGKAFSGYADAMDSMDISGYPPPMIEFVEGIKAMARHVLQTVAEAAPRIIAPNENP